MNIFSLLSTAARLGFVVAVGCALMLNPSEAKLIIDRDASTNSYLYAMYHSIVGNGTYIKDADVVKPAILKIQQHIPRGSVIDRRLNEILPDNNRKFRMEDIYNGNAGNPQIKLQCELKHPDPDRASTRGMSDDGIIHLYGQGIAANVRFRFSKKTYLSPLPNDAELINEQALWESQVLHTLFHESGHVLLRKNCQIFDVYLLPDLRENLKASVVKSSKDIDEKVYDAIILKENDINVLHEAFAVYCDYLCCKYIERRPDFTLERFILDTIDDATVQTSACGSKVLYGITLDYMWKFIVSLDYRESTLDDGKPCKALFDAYQNKVEQRGDTAWAQQYSLANMWFKGEAARAIKKANPKTSQSAWIAYNALLVSQVKTYSSKLPRSLPMHIPDSAH